MRIIIFCLLSALLLAHAGYSQIKPVQLDEFALSGESLDVSIGVNPRNTKNIVAVVGKGRAYVTHDGGATWQKVTVASTLGVGENPVVLFDSKGDLYYIHTSGDEKKYDQLVCQTSKDGGKTWDEGSGFGMNPSKSQYRFSATIDGKDNVHVAWIQFDQLNSMDEGCVSNVMISKSSNGRKWNTPVLIAQTPGDCLPNSSVKEATPSVSAEGRTLVTWSNKNNIFMDRSYDGSLWLTTDMILTTRASKHALTILGSTSGTRTTSFVVDRSKVVTRGNLYLVYQDQVDNNKGVGIWLMKSSNFGDIWVSPLRVAPEEAMDADQFLPSVAVDQSSGIVYVLYYSRSPETGKTDVYLSYSINAAHSFKSVKLNESSFDPDPSMNVPYLTVAAARSTIAPIWIQTDNGKATVWTVTVAQDELLKDLKSN